MIGDFHVHTCYCDGEATPRQMAEAASARGFTALGFTGHAFTPFDPGYCMSPEAAAAYAAEVRALAAEYAGRMDILLGAELDLFGENVPFRPDYAVGSIHYVRVGEDYVSVDDTRPLLQEGIGRHFVGDPLALARAYFRQYEKLPDLPGVRIIGHFDLLTKFGLIDEEDPRYRAAALEALEGLAGRDLLLEINTGAMSRGYRAVPYPAPFLLRRWHELGEEIILSGDAHSPQGLACAFDEAAALARDCGFRDRAFLTRDGYVMTAL